MIVLTVCRMNQARSPFAQAVISNYFPNIHVTSAGLQAINGISYLPEVISIARRWGIEISTGPSRSINSIPEIELANIIICADEWISAGVNRMSPIGQVISYESVAPDPSFLPTDPEKLRGRDLETELAKVAWINLRAIADFVRALDANQITAVIPETDLNIGAVIDRVIEERRNGDAVVVDADLRSPLARDFRTRGLTVGNLANLSQNDNFDVFSSIVELDEPERVLLSKKWRAEIDSLAKKRRILLVTGPQRTKGGPLPDSYLAAIPAGKIEIIRS